MYSAPGASVICLRERSKRPKPKRSVFGVSRPTDGASTGPGLAVDASSASERPLTFGNCVTDGTLGGVAPIPVSDPPLEPQEERATQSAAIANSRPNRIGGKHMRLRTVSAPYGLPG